MEKDYLPSDSVMELEFVTKPYQVTHYHENFEMLYVLNGQVTVTVEDQSYSLKEKDIIVVNYNRKHSYSGSSDLLMARLIISYNKVRILLDNDLILFWCNSTIENDESYDELRKMMNRILNQHMILNAKNKIYQVTLYYQLLNLLSKDFLMSAKDTESSRKLHSDDRMGDIFQYLRTNYQNNVTLQELADHFFLSTAYLSKYIKRKCDVGFTDLLSNIRLSHAMVDLLHSDTSVMKIAMDNGFASVAAYNKAFKVAYGQTPSQFRRHSAIAKTKVNQRPNGFEDVQEKLQEFLKHEPVSMEDRNKTNLNINMNMQHLHKQKWNNSFTSLINGGTLIDLTKADFQKQLLLAKKELSIKYVRCWDIYAPEMRLDIKDPANNSNFSVFDNAIDFLIKNDLKPYIDLGFKPIRLLRNTHSAIVEVERNEDFRSEQQRSQFYSVILKHCVNRYGADAVSGWFFEYWKSEKIAVTATRYQYLPQDEVSNQLYFQQFSTIAKVMRSILSEVQIGGGGFPVRHYGTKGLKQLFEQWSEYDEMPNFLTFTCYPYQLKNEDGVFYEKKSASPWFVRESLEMVQTAVLSSHFKELPIHVTEYGLSLSNRNALNDHCAKGAYLLQNAFESYGKAELFGYWLLSDLYGDYNDSHDLLFGGCGLLTKVGIPKPSFFALSFLKELYPEVLYQSDNCIITGNQHESFKIVMHNYKKLSFNYFLMDEDQVSVRVLPRLFEDHDDLQILINILNVNFDAYNIKTSLINDDSGNIQKEWMNLNSNVELSIAEQTYLSRISTPKLLNQTLTANKQRLQLKTTMMENEIRLITITPMNLHFKCNTKAK